MKCVFVSLAVAETNEEAQCVCELYKKHRISKEQTHNISIMDIDKRKFGTCIVRQCLLVVLISSFVASVKFGLISPIGK